MVISANVKKGFVLVVVLTGLGGLVIYEHGSRRVAVTVLAVPAPIPAVEMVHVTRTGSHYHKAGCPSLESSDITESKALAVSQGLTPCKKCGG